MPSTSNYQARRPSGSSLVSLLASVVDLIDCQPNELRNRSTPSLLVSALRPRALVLHTRHVWFWLRLRFEHRRILGVGLEGLEGGPNRQRQSDPQTHEDDHNFLQDRHAQLDGDVSGERAELWLLGKGRQQRV